MLIKQKIFSLYGIVTLSLTYTLPGVNANYVFTLCERK